MPHNIFTNASKSVREHNFAGDVSFDRMILYGCDSIWLWFGHLSEYDKNMTNIIASQPLRVTQLFLHFYSRTFFPLINISLSAWRPNKGYHCKFSNFLSTLCFSPQCLEFVTLWQVKWKQWSTTRKEKLAWKRILYVWKSLKQTWYVSQIFRAI